MSEYINPPSVPEKNDDDSAKKEIVVDQPFTIPGKVVIRPPKKDTEEE